MVNAGVKVKKIKVHNLYSYYDAEFDLEDYNVIVGPNGAGKTNIVRILKLLTENRSLEHTRITTLLNMVNLPKLYKFDRSDRSYILIKLFLTRYEIKLILQFLFDEEIEESSIPAILDTLNILVYWIKPLRDEEVPTYLMCKFDKSAILFTWEREFGSSLFQVYIDEREMEDIIDDIHKSTIQSSKHVNMASILRNAESEYFKLDSNKRTLCVKNPQDPQTFSDEPIVSPLKPKNNITLNNTLTYSPSNPSKQLQDIIDLIRLIEPSFMQQNSSDYQISFWQLITNLLYARIILLQEHRPRYDELTNEFQSLVDRGYHSKEYEEFENSIQTIFGIKFDIRSLPDSNKHIFVVTDKTNEIALEDSASGYFEVLYLLLNIFNKNNSLIILDEPALHLHPIKIKQLANELKKLVEQSGNQVILITHSPYFVTHELLEDKSTNLLYIRKDDNGSKVHHKPKDFRLEEIEPRLVPHLFKSDIFFSQYTIIVEGPSDQAVLSAMSHNLDMILENNNIVIVYADSKEYISTYIKLFDTYGISYTVMKDSDNDQDMEETNTIFLESKLETELKKLYRDVNSDLQRKLIKIWKNVNNNNSKIKELEAYQFIDTLMKDKEGRIKIKNSKFYQVFKQAFEKIQKLKELEEAWNKQK